MIKSKGCLVFLLGSAAVVVTGLILIGVFVFSIFWGMNEEETVKLPDNISPETVKLQADPFYRKTGGWDYSRLPLIKPYELIACDKRLEDACLHDISNKRNSVFGKQICGVKKINVFKNYFIAYVDGFGNSGFKYCYLIIDFKRKGYPELRIWHDYNHYSSQHDKFSYLITVSYGDKKTYIESQTKELFIDQASQLGFSLNRIKHNQIGVYFPDEYQNSVFFNKVEFIEGLKKRGIPENIELFEPAYFYRKFLDEGQCPWFPKANKPKLPDN